MDEAFFDLTSGRRTRRVAPLSTPIKAQTSLASTAHITVVATISTQDAPVPPFLIYPGVFLLEEWVRTRDKEPNMQAGVLESGWINGFLAHQWLVDWFGPLYQSQGCRCPTSPPA